MLRKSALQGTAILWIACLIFVSVHPIGSHAPQGSTTHRVEHVVAFGILGLMLLSLCRNSGQTWLVILALFCFGCGLELRQHQLFRQPFEWWDVRDDGIGLLLALLLLRFTRIRAFLVR